MPEMRLTPDERLPPPWPMDDPSLVRRWLAVHGVRDVDRGLRTLRDLVKPGRPDGLLAGLLQHLQLALPQCPDGGMALTNLGRFLDAATDVEATLSILALDPRTTEVLFQIFGMSQFLSEQMIRDPELLFWLRAGAERRDRERLVDEIWEALRTAGDDDARRLSLLRFRHRETLRIGYNDLVRGQPLEDITTDLALLAEACLEAATRHARTDLAARYGEPRTAHNRPAAFSVLAFGKLGGSELNYSSDIDLMFVYDEDGQTDGARPIANAEFFARMSGEVVRLLSDHTAHGRAFRVDLRLRPYGDQGPLACSLRTAVGYYETVGRTWERQALIKCRPVAGDLHLGHRFLAAITPFVYRRYLGAAEISEIKAIKRRIETRTLSEGTDSREVKTGRGGIRDVEFVVQFLQLLHGGLLPEVRHTNTLQAMARLEQVGCLSVEERAILEDTYRFLRQVEHRLQIMFDRQTHEMPADEEELRVFAIRMGFPPASPWEDPTGPSRRFLSAYRTKTERNRRILNHLLHDAFPDDVGVDPVVDLVLDPEPPPDLRSRALGRYRFRDEQTAYWNLMALAREEIPFLPQGRCRHFLAAIAPRLLQAIAATPDPDLTLTNLEKVSASLGAKGVLWELFSFNPPTLRLYVELCATSQFLCEILINNPGMIDDLMDSLVVDQAQSAEAIREELAGLCKGAEDLGPILFGFRNKEFVRIGTRDILGREPVRDVTRELADVAEAIVNEVATDQWRRRVKRFGEPRCPDGVHPARWAIVALGKLGGRELSYHGDLDLIFLYESDGQTNSPEQPLDNLAFFTGLAQRILQDLGGPAASGPLYRVDTRLRPHGGSGPLAVTLAALRDYHRETARLWERLAMTRARVVHETGGFGRTVQATLHDLLCEPVNLAALAEEILSIRRRQEEAASPGDFRRGPGGLMDIEFLIQFLQLAHGRSHPAILTPNAWEALDALKKTGLIDESVDHLLRESYDVRRMIECRLRIVRNRPTSELPTEPEELVPLARRLHAKAADTAQAIAAFREEFHGQADRVRALFLDVIGRARDGRS